MKWSLLILIGVILVVAAQILTGILAAIHIRWYIWIIFSLIDVIGLFVTIYIPKITVERKINEATVKMQSIKSGVSDSSTESELEKTQDKFKEWAKGFLALKEYHKIDYEKSRLSSLEKELDICKQFNPFFNEAVETIRNFIQAYNVENNSRFKINLPKTPIPVNLYESKYEGVINLGEKEIHIVIRGLRPATSSSPFMTICFEEANSMSYGNCIYFQARLLDPPQMTLTPTGNIILPNESPAIISMDNYHDILYQLLKKIIEFQLLQLRN